MRQSGAAGKQAAADLSSTRGRRLDDAEDVALGNLGAGDGG